MRRPAGRRPQAIGARDRPGIEVVVAEAPRQQAAAAGPESLDHAREVGLAHVGRVLLGIGEAELIGPHAGVLIEQPAALTAREREAAGNAEGQVALREQRRGGLLAAQRARHDLEFEHRWHYNVRGPEMAPHPPALVARRRSRRAPRLCDRRHLRNTPGAGRRR